MIKASREIAKNSRIRDLLFDLKEGFISSGDTAAALKIDEQINLIDESTKKLKELLYLHAKMMPNL